LFQYTEEFSAGISTDEMFGEVCSSSGSMEDSIYDIDDSSCKKRKLDEEVIMVSNNLKKPKIRVLDQVRDVCGLLKTYRIHQNKEAAAEKNRRYRFLNPIGTAQTYLNAIFGSTPATPQELLKIATPASSLQCKTLSSLVGQAQTKKVQMKLSAWAPVKTHSSAFPESHVGIGQIAAASRAFHSGMSEIISHSVLQKLKFSVSIPQHAAISSKYGDQLSAPFVWKSEGMLAMGYPEEFEFNGLIRCSLAKEGVSSASISFDACKILRQHETMLEPQPVSVGVL